MQNASLNASFASVMESGLGGGTPNRSFTSMRSAVRAAIPKNFVKDRARAIEGIPLIGDLDGDGGGDDRKKADPASSGEALFEGGGGEYILYGLVWCCVGSCPRNSGVRPDKAVLTRGVVFPATRPYTRRAAGLVAGWLAGGLGWKQEAGGSVLLVGMLPIGAPTGWSGVPCVLCCSRGGGVLRRNHGGSSRAPPSLPSGRCTIMLSWSPCRLLALPAASVASPASHDLHPLPRMTCTPCLASPDFHGPPTSPR